jgi:CBS domain-containing protein
LAQPRSLTAADIMTRNVVTKDPNDGIGRVAAEMQRRDIGSVVIVENQKLVGIITERDFVRIVERVGALLEKNLVKDHMSKPVITVQSDAPVADVMRLMSEKHVRHVIVLGKSREIAGIISSRDLMKVSKDLMSV